MATKIKQLTMTTFLSISITSCATDLSEGFSYDYATAKVSDFNGEWTGSPICVAGGEKYQVGTIIQVTDGVGALIGYGGFGDKPTANLDLNSGEIRWTGSFDWQGTELRFSLNGQWRDEKFRVKGKRGIAKCSGELWRTAAG